MGGMAAGVYGQVNGFETQIAEMHRVPGGQCAAWKRKRYAFDGCIHHLFDCDPRLRLYGLWEELGAMPRDLIPVEDCVSALSPEGTLFKDYYDPERLREGCDSRDTFFNTLRPFVDWGFEHQLEV